MDRKIARVLLLGDKVAIRKPIAAAVVYDALPKACKRDPVLCEEVRRYLNRFMHAAGITDLQVGLAASNGDSKMAIPNDHGQLVDSGWKAAALAYYQPSDYLLFSAGGIAYEGEAVPTGSLLSMGFDFAQLDIGYRDHWFSPLNDSSSLISTHAATMPSITLSNYEPITAVGFNYEIFAAQMSHQDGILYYGGTTSGSPYLAGLQVGIEPVSGYAVALNRVMQYGGGARGGGGASGFFDALFNNSNKPDAFGQSEEFGNQVASLTSSILFPASIPFAVHAEYSGEDNAYAGQYRLGDTNFSLGIDFPMLWKSFDFAFEVSEWQNDWYVHHLYPEGLTNDGHVIGHWFGDQRFPQDAIGGSSQSLRFGWRRESGDYFQLTYRTMALDTNWRGGQPPSYERLQTLGVNWSTAWKGHAVNMELSGGQDVFGDSFARIAASVDLAHDRTRSGDLSSGNDTDDSVDLFIDLGANYSSVHKVLAVSIPNTNTPSESNAHLGFGARRSVSTHNDLGVRLELDEVDGNRLLSFRAVDYRFRFTPNIAASGFIGAARYDIGLPAYGYYWGAGLQYMNLFSTRWDLGLDFRHHEKLGRDKALPTDPPSSIAEGTRVFFDVNGTALYLSRRW
jgi:hypothetical protein